MTVSEIGTILVQLTIVALVGWSVSCVVVQLLPERSELGLPERALIAVVGFLAYCVAAMLLHVVTGGAVFGAPLMLPLLTIAWLFATRRRFRAPRGVPWAAVAAAVILLVAIYVAPAIAAGSGVRTGDPPWHLGWTEQLLGGEPVPTGPAPEFGRNAYPWGWHAVLATTTRLVPGSDPLTSHETLHLLIVLAIPLAAACLARQVNRRAGWAAAASASLIGGFGWLIARGPAFVASPGDARFGADLVVASPNSVYELFPPALPRELGLVALGCAGMLLSLAFANKSRPLHASAGIAVGLTGLVSVPLFVSAVAWAAVTVGLSKERAFAARWILGPAAATFALWAGPVVGWYARYGGFVNITPQLGKEWSLPLALASWGLLLPLAVTGIVWTVGKARGRPLLAFGIVTALLMAAAFARGAFDWTLGGNATLLHAGRVWPPAHLLAAAYAGIGLTALYVWAAARSRALATIGATAILLVGAASPVMASMGIHEILEEGEDGFVYAGPDVASGSFVRSAADVLGPADVVRVQGSDELAFLLFEFTGAKISDYDDPRLDGNELRIRYNDLAEAWDERMAAGGFEADYLVLPASNRSGQRSVASGTFEGSRWVMLKLG